MERGNLFTLSLGNVQPDDLIVIRFAYFEELDAWKDELALQIPFSPGVRYIPGEPLLRSNGGRGAVDDTDQVPDASRISPPRIDQMHPDVARLSLSGKLDGRDVDLCSISSPTHGTAVRPTDNAFEIFLPANAALPDRDPLLTTRACLPRTGSYWGAPTMAIAIEFCILLWAPEFLQQVVGLPATSAAAAAAVFGLADLS